ncbi:MAG: protein translocase subunit SecD, partial [Planctomycetes bacterium]|nr:protein translocase subunit SecD [Planctomycetota bacterium]
MAQTQTLVPDFKSKTVLFLVVLAAATWGLFERRTKFTLEDGTTITGTVVEETEESLTIERASGQRKTLSRAKITDQDWLNFEVDLNLGLDLMGGTALRYRIDLDGVAPDARAGLLERTIDTYSSRLDNLGVKELSIRLAGEDEISVELPGVSMEESEAYERVILSLGRLEFRIVAQSKAGELNLSEEEKKLKDHLKALKDGGQEWTARSVDLRQFDIPGSGGISYRWFPYTEKTIREEGRQEFPFVLLEIDDKNLITGEDIEDTYPQPDSRGNPALGFKMKSSRAGAFGSFTEEHLERLMAIVLDGEVSTAPKLNSRIDQSGIIEGGGMAGFKTEEVKALRTVLSSGSLQVKPEKLSRATIGPTLGEASIDRGVLAGILASLVVVAFIGTYYLAAGIISCLTLLLGMYLLVGGLGFLGATLTLPGIAGIVLTVGMAVDQNILINERIREERAKGKTLFQSVKNGFERAFVTIVDAQVTTLIAGVTLFYYGTGPVRGFAVTLMLGIVTTMFASLLGSKLLFSVCLDREIFKDLRMLSMVKETSIRFSRYLMPSLIFSGLTILGGLALFAYDYDSLKGVDFAGGFQAHIRLKEPLAQQEVFAAIRPLHDTVQVVSMAGEGAAAGSAETRDFRITIRGSAEEEAVAGDQRERFLADITTVLGERMLPQGVDDIQVAPDATNQRSTATFTLNFSAPIAQETVQGSLADRIAVDSIEPVSGASPAEAYRVAARYGVVVNPDRVKAETASALVDLPGGVRLSDPIPESQFIGGKVGGELRNSAIKAIILAVLLILIYIRVRFHDLYWGLAACIATVHDVLFGMGAVALVHYTGLINIELDLTMVGAFLTIVGYSLNDTIVIFDRVRENLPRVAKPLVEVIDLSINQTLARTLLTALTSLLAIVILLVLNLGQGNVLEGFAFVMFVGVFVGTYSTVFIASPLLVT